MTEMEQVNTDFEFDCPQFTDFTADIEHNISEEFCQEYFDKKTEEIKRNSNEFNKENIENQEDKENTKQQPIDNLLSATDFANISKISNKSNVSSHYASNCSKITKQKSALTTEEMQLIALRQKKIEISKLKEKNAKNVAKMKDEHRVFQPTRSTKLTIPITPALHTTIRAKQRLRKDKQRKMSDTNIFMNHCKKRKASYSATTTIPQSFKLSKTKKRRTACAVLSTEEKELKEIQKRGAFQARKINPKIFKSSAPNIGILNNIKNKPSTTTVQPFNLLTEKRAQKHNTQKS